jgi:Glycosyltransferase 61
MIKSSTVSDILDVTLEREWHLPSEDLEVYKSRPKSINANTSEVLEDFWRSNSHPIFVAQIQRALYLPALSAAVCLNSGICYVHRFFDYKSDCAKIIQTIDYLNKNIDSLIANAAQLPSYSYSLVTEWDSAYFHFWTETLEKLLLFDLYYKSPPPKAILLSAPLKRFQIEALNLIGVGAPVYGLPRVGSYLADNLYLPSYCSPCGTIFKKISTRINELILPRLEYMCPKDFLDAKPTRIYVSRNDAPTRRLRSEDALIDSLSKIGFTPLLLSNMPLHQQIVAFRRAECVVGAHGAGLTNIIFDGINSTKRHLFEIIGSQYQNACYYDVGIRHSYDYHYLVAKEETYNGDLVVDSEEICDLCSTIASS